MKNNKYRKSLKLVNQIQKIRSKNNKNWMNLLRLALKLDHKSTSKILSEIYIPKIDCLQGKVCDGNRH